MWFKLKEGGNKLEHPQPEALGLGYTHINHQIFPASTRDIPSFPLLCSTVPAHHQPCSSPKKIYYQNSLFISFGNSGLQR